MPRAGVNTGGTVAGADAPRGLTILTGNDFDLIGDLHVAGDVTVGGAGLQRRIGIAKIESNFTTSSTSYVDITGGSLTIPIPTPANLVLAAWLPVLIEEAIAGQTAVTSGSRSSGVVTMNSTSHGLVPGRIAQVTVADTTYNGQYVVASTPSANQFTYAQTGVGDDAASGTGVVGPAGNLGGGADIRLVTGSGPTVIAADSTPRAQFANQAMSFFLRAELPASTHTPTAGATVTYRLQMKSTHTTSDASVFVDFAGPQNVAYLAAWEA